MGVSLAMTVDAAKPTGRIILKGARVLTMTGDGAGAIDDAMIVIEGDRIVSVGSADAMPIPLDGTLIDVTGKVIMPGLVDAHAHGPYGTGDLIPQQNWSQVQDLAEKHMGRVIVEPVLYLFDKLRWLQHGDIHLYIGYILLAIVVLLFFV